MRSIPYENREEAAQSLFALMEETVAPPLCDEHRSGTPERRWPYDLVLGLCRGGVPVAVHLARAMGLPMDVLIVRKLPTPGNPELALGAMVENGAEALNEDVLRWIPRNAEVLAHVRSRELEELRRRSELYRHGRAAPELRGLDVLVVDDGAATGATARAAVASARMAGAHRVDVALPVAPPETGAEIESVADRLFCPWRPTYFLSVGNYYQHFPQVSDSEVQKALELFTEHPPNLSNHA